jgi:hypothetical protein
MKKIELHYTVQCALKIKIQPFLDAGLSSKEIMEGIEEIDDPSAADPSEPITQLQVLKPTWDSCLIVKTLNDDPKIIDIIENKLNYLIVQKTKKKGTRGSGPQKLH